MNEIFQYNPLNLFEKVILVPMITVIITIVGWSLVNIIELKSDVAIVKTDIKHITKQIDFISERIVKLNHLTNFSVVVRDEYAVK